MLLSPRYSEQFTKLIAFPLKRHNCFTFLAVLKIASINSYYLHTYNFTLLFKKRILNENIKNSLRYIYFHEEEFNDLMKWIKTQWLM